MKTSRKMPLIVMGMVNLAGAACYLALASAGWVEPEVADIPGAASGGAVIWFFTAVPMLALFVALNLVIAPVQLVVYARKKEWFSAVAALAIPTLVWIAAVQIDFAHHGV